MSIHRSSNVMLLSHGKCDATILNEIQPDDSVRSATWVGLLT